MSKSVIIITGCDSFFYPYMDETLRSLIALRLHEKAEIGILDLGLKPEEIASLTALGCTIKTPEWTLKVPEPMRVQKMLGLIARTALREYFPGFSTYLWFDADAWAQTPEFFDILVEGAKAKGAGIVRENGSGVRRNYIYNRWWYGHMMTCYGLINGFKVAFKPAVNIGILALSDTAEHWGVWARDYQRLIAQKGKLNLDQHAFNAVLELEHLPYALAPARCNWICTLSSPVWDKERRLFCEPGGKKAPLSVLHLAGPNKRRDYSIAQHGGGTLVTPLTYSAFTGLAGR